MAKKTVKEISAWFEGISDFSKLGGTAQYQNGRSIDHRSDARSIKLQPRTIKESGTVVTDLPKWAISPPTTCGSTFIYGDTGNFYERSSSGSYTKLATIPESHGNGMAYFGEDNFIYYTSDKLIGRYGPICTSNPQFTNDFVGSQGGNRTNSHSLNLRKASSQYASRASTSSLQVAGNLSIESWVHLWSLPTGANTYTIASKWDESGATRSYKLDILPTSDFFGDGSDGALTISSNTTEAPVDSACYGLVGTTTLSATNASFTAGQVVLIHQSRGVTYDGQPCGTWMKNKIASYTSGTITLESALTFSPYSSGNSCAQVRVLKQYSSVTVNNGVTWTAKAWDGTVGGILGFVCNGTFTNNGTITATGKGFRGGTGVRQATSYQGEGSGGAGTQSTSANGNGGGGGKAVVWGGGSYFGHGGGGGGGNASSGTNGYYYGNNGDGGVGGGSSGSADLTTMTFGGGGGGAGTDRSSQGSTQNGGNGGGIICPWSVTITNNGYILSNGNSTPDVDIATETGSAGAGGAGSILLKAQTATLGSSIITAIGGTAGNMINSNPYNAQGSGRGGGASNGRNHLDYLTSYSGTTNPTLDATQDNNLASGSSLIIRLQLSSNGTNSETYYKPISITTEVWTHFAAVWDSFTSTCEFYQDGVSIGTQTGSFTSIDANASTFQVGMYKNGSGTASGFIDALIDEVRIWGITLTDEDILLGMNNEILSTSNGLKAYYSFNTVLTDSTTYGNNLTGSGSPTYSTDVPFTGASTRFDIDQSQVTAGQTYTLPSAISENAADKATFTPEKDPQKSIAIQVATVGTGDWTLTVHDQYNNTVASKTVVNASMAVGLFEFVFSTPWTPELNADYHFHITSSDGTGTVTTGSNADLSTVSYRTYFQVLVTDTDYHPVFNFLQFLVVGNGRYVGTIEATLWEPHMLTLEAGYKVRCFGLWNEYLAIGCWKGSTVQQYDNGRIYFWDGTSETYNFFIDVPEGAVNAMIGSRGKLYFIAGYRGKLMLYEGGAQARKIKNLVNTTEPDSSIDIFPGAMTMWRALLRFAAAGNIDDTQVQRGVYTWGSINERFPDSLSFDYPISTGNYLTTVKIGMLHVVNTKLLIGWNDGAAYGVDYISMSNDPYPTGTCELLIEDDGAMYHQKEAVTVTAQFEPLTTGESVQLKYKLNRDDSWTEMAAVTDADATTARSVLVTNGTRYREYQVGVNLATTTTTSPVVYGISIEKDMLEEEKRVG